MTTRVGLWGQLGSTNIGNDGSLEAVLNWLAEAQPAAVVDSMCSGHERVRLRYGLPTTPLHWCRSYERSVSGPVGALHKVLGKVLDAFRTLRWVARHDVVIVPGMGVLESTMPLRPWGFPYALFTLCAAGRLTGCTVALVDVGADFVVNPVTRKLITCSARLAGHRSYRDDLSLAAMRRMGVPTNPEQVVADLVFSLPTPREQPAEPGTVGVGVMSWHGADGDQRDAADLHANYVATICGFVRWLLGSGRRVRLLTGDQADVAVVRAVQEDVTAAGVGEDRLVFEPTSTVDELIGQMAGVDAVVATRYHNVVCALRLAKPTVSVSYAAKSDVLMAGMGLAEFCHPARSPNLHRLIEQFIELESRREELREEITERSARAAERLRRQADELSAELFCRPDPQSPRPRAAPGLRGRLRQVATDSFRVYQRAIGSLGFGQSESRISADARTYWAAPPTDGSKARSHWRDAQTFADNDVWQQIGAKHLEMYHRAARTVGRRGPMGRVLEWGCGGGANAVHFAPVATEFIGVEISQDSLDECAKQLTEVTDVPFRPILVDIDQPEQAIEHLGGPVDLFLCVYVFELIPTPEYGARLLDIVSSVLAPDGVGLIQIKYSTDSWRTRSRRRHYRSGMADMTTYAIDSFWRLLETCGLRPVSVELVPEDELDERYAYFTVTRPVRSTAR